MNLTGKQIVLTGATGGIGRALALQLAKQGAVLKLVGRDQGRLDALVAELQAAGGQAHSFVADLSSAEACTQLAQQAECDVLINNAGQMFFGQFATMESQQIESLMHTNLLAPMLLTRAYLPSMLQHPEAAIVNVGSTFGSLGFGFFTSYCASKFGLRGFSEALRRELQDSTVNVLYVAPRAVDTPLNTAPVQAFNQATNAKVDPPEWVAAQIVAALQGDKKELLLGQPESFFARLNQLLPRLIDRAVTKQMQLAAQQCRSEPAAKTTA